MTIRTKSIITLRLKILMVLRHFQRIYWIMYDWLKHWSIDWRINEGKFLRYCAFSLYSCSCIAAYAEASDGLEFNPNRIQSSRDKCRELFSSLRRNSRNWFKIVSDSRIGDVWLLLDCSKLEYDACIKSCEAHKATIKPMGKNLTFMKSL